MKSPFFLVTKVWELFDMEHNNSVHPYLTRNNNKSSCHSLKEWKRSSWQEQEVAWGWERLQNQLPHFHRVISTTFHPLPCLWCGNYSINSIKGLCKSRFKQFPDPLFNQIFNSTCLPCKKQVSVTCSSIIHTAMDCLLLIFVLAASLSQVGFSGNWCHDGTL